MTDHTQLSISHLQALYGRASGLRILPHPGFDRTIPARFVSTSQRTGELTLHVADASDSHDIEDDFGDNVTGGHVDPLTPTIVYLHGTDEEFPVQFLTPTDALALLRG